MTTLTITTPTGQNQEVILVNRIDANMFACKTSARKRNSDILVHVDFILTDVSSISFEEETGTDTTRGAMSQDEFDGLCQAGEMGLQFPNPT